MKGIKQRGNKLYFNHGDQRRAKSYTTPAKALDALRVIEGAILDGQITIENLVRKPVKAEKKNISFYIDLWLATGAKQTLKASTLEDNHAILKNHIKGTGLDAPTVDKITQLDVENFLLKKLKSRSNSTVTHIRNVLSGGFKTAIKDRTILTNPCHGFKISTKADACRKPKIEPLTAKEIQTLLSTFEKHCPGQHDLALLLARTGMRIGEAVALKWSDVNFNDRYITVERNFTRGRFETPKNGKTRNVDISKVLLAALRERKLKVQKESKFIFPSKGKLPVDPKNWRKRTFIPMLEKAELRKVRVHDLRHSYASLIIKATKNMHYAKEQLGHSSIKVTIDIYGHLLTPEGKEREVDILDNLANAN